MSSLYLEQYLQSVETLPSDLQRNFTLMRELDKQSEAESQWLAGNCTSFLKDMKKLSSAERKQRLSKIQNVFKAALDLGDQKVTLALQTYETVDQHIRQLDNDLSRFETETAADQATPKSHKHKKEEGASGRKKLRRDNPGDLEGLEDMPVDPNEPTYCLCHQVSFGEMIACDNPDCSTEWFHFACVNLKAKPKSKWYCPRCQVDMDRGKHR